jgi:hypothetical protein
MAVGDQAAAAGYPLVPETGEEGRVRWGALIAAVKALVPTGKAAYRSAAGITSGTTEPTGGNDGDIYFKIIS